MKTNLFQKVMALICAATLLVSVLPVGSAQADERPGTPEIQVEVRNDSDIKITIGKTRGADGYEVWITSDCGYEGYKNKNDTFGDYNYNDNLGDYIRALTIENVGSGERIAVIKNLSVERVSVKVRAFFGTIDPIAGAGMGYGKEKYGEFSTTKTVKLSPQKKGYKSSYNFAKVKKGDTIWFGSYEQDYPVNGKDPIEWVVLEKNKKGILVISKYALDCLPYNTENAEVTWETSTLRRWLNEKFYNAAFNKTEKKMIRKTTVKNKENPIGVDGGNDTKDKVFLLSIDDVTKENYGFDEDRRANDVNRRCAPTEYAIAQGAGFSAGYYKDYYTDQNEGAGWWWLRSPSYKAISGRYLFESIGRTGYSVFVDYDDNVAVRPVMFLKLKSK